MSKRKRSRLTRTDVSTICEMQRKICAYENYLVGLCKLIQHRGELQRAVILCDTPMDDFVNTAWNTYKNQSKELKHESIYDILKHQ